uniref:Beta-galactosidase n=2 Tax=Homalodisca liturata TaxID=320908 RepID=A0A1B6HET1_9HEMI
MGSVRVLGLYLTILAVLATNTAKEITSNRRSFEVDYENDQFLKDGQPFRYVSGSLHYFRVPREYWQDRLRKLRAAGLNVVSTYIEWSRHEPRRGQYDFTGDNDIEHFIKLAEQEGLLVILRPGPYICAERDLGGYPPWILHENLKMILRTNDSSHTHHVRSWLEVFLRKIQPYLYGNGGPVIMVQIENEYGSYPICDRRYTFWLRDIFQSYIGSNAVLFTTDGNGSFYLRCGPIPGVFITVDFGHGVNVMNAFKPLRAVQPHGPLVNSEFYTGWLTHWGEPEESGASTSGVVNTTRSLLAMNASLNFFMFFGGTNFGFTSGANNPPFQPQLTSYNYDAPISEAGDLTDKYFAIKSVISEFFPIAEIPVGNSSKGSYGRLVLEPKISLRDSDTGIVYNNTTYPQTFEALELYSGLLWYETTLPLDFSGTSLLMADDLHDRAIVYINKTAVGVLSRSTTTSMFISEGAGQPLSLLVENQGHINYGQMMDLKGLVKNVTLDGEVLTDWKQTGYPLDNVSHVATLPTVEHVDLPAFYSARFQLPEGLETPLDTFVDMTGWSKGVLYVNGHNLGRYWPVEGPQVTLYLPGPYLFQYPDYNTILVLELEKIHPDRTIEFVPAPIWRLKFYV